jgi:hypothetical protein
VLSGEATNTIGIVFGLAIDRFLFGTPDPRDDKNNSLFLNVQNFIVSSKRFT